MYVFCGTVLFTSGKTLVIVFANSVSVFNLFKSKNLLKPKSNSFLLSLITSSIVSSLVAGTVKFTVPDKIRFALNVFKTSTASLSLFSLA
ncbi:hypothetical protein D9M68_887800 [compost metagenome]